MNRRDIEIREKLGSVPRMRGDEPLTFIGTVDRQ